MQLRAHIAQAQDGTHDELREHRLKGGVVQKAALGLGVAAVDVRDVGDALKYIEAHAERQGDAEKEKSVFVSLPRFSRNQPMYLK